MPCATNIFAKLPSFRLVCYLCWVKKPTSSSEETRIVGCSSIAKAIIRAAIIMALAVSILKFIRFPSIYLENKD